MRLYKVNKPWSNNTTLIRPFVNKLGWRCNKHYEENKQWRFGKSPCVLVRKRGAIHLRYNLWDVYNRDSGKTCRGCGQATKTLAHVLNVFSLFVLRGKRNMISFKRDYVRKRWNDDNTCKWTLLAFQWNTPTGQYTPKLFRKNRTRLIPKKEDCKSSPTMWRPIIVSSILLRISTQVLFNCVIDELSTFKGDLLSRFIYCLDHWEWNC